MLDICVIAVAALFTWFGYRKGLIRTIFSLLSIVASLVLAWMLYPVVSNVLVGFGLHSFIAGAAGKVLVGEAQLPAIFSGLVDNTAAGAATLIVNIISLILVFVLCKLLIMVIGKALDIVGKLPVIRQFNKLGGIVAGFAKGVLFCYIIFALLVVFAPMQNHGEVQKAIDSSTIASKMYYDNLLLKMINK